MKLPGTVPPKVQKVYVTPSEIAISFSTTSSSTITLAGAVRPVGGGTMGGAVSTALTGSPCGGPKSPCAEPSMSSPRAPAGVSAVAAAGGQQAERSRAMRVARMWALQPLLQRKNATAFAAAN